MGISATLVQDILRPGEIDLKEREGGEAPGDSAILCAASMSVRSIDASFLRVLATGSQFRFGQTQDRAVQQTASVTSGRLHLQIRHAASLLGRMPARFTVSGIPNAARSVMLDASIQGCSGNLKISNETLSVAFGLSESSLDFVSSAAELVTGTVHSWFVVARVIERAVLSAQYRVLPMYRRLITEILQSAHDEGILTDPLFLNRPTIVPLRTRSDLSWKVLAHIRHCLRQTSPQAHARLRQGLLSNVATMSDDDFSIIVPLLQEWHSWELDATSVRHLNLFGYLFPRQASKQAVESFMPEAPFSWDTPAQISLCFGTFVTAFYEEEESANRMQLYPCEIFGSYTGRGLQRPSSQTSVVLRISLGALIIELDPAFVRLVRHVGRVRKTFEAKLSPLIPRPQVADYTEIPYEAPLSSQYLRYTPPSSLPISISVLMQSMDLTTQAQGVRASSTLQRIHGSTTITALIKATETTIPLDGEAFVGCESIRLLAATEHRDRGELKGSGGSTLASIQLQDLLFSAALKDISPRIPELQVSCVIASSRIRVPRSILRMSQL